MVVGMEVSSDRGSVTNRAGEQSCFQEGGRPTNQVSLEDKKEVNLCPTWGARGRREKQIFAVSVSSYLVQFPRRHGGEKEYFPGIITPDSGRVETRIHPSNWIMQANFKKEFMRWTVKLYSCSARWNIEQMSILLQASIWIQHNSNQNPKKTA